MSAHSALRLALLVDGENVSPRAAEEIFAAAAARGAATVRRVFGDWQRSSVGGWRTAALQWAMETIHQTSHSSGDGASDVRIAIAAMDLLYSGRVDGFCLVSGDGDFAPLAHRLRVAGLPVYGIGPAHTARSFQLACTEFTALRSISGARPQSPVTSGTSAAQSPLDPAAVELLVDAVAAAAGRDGWSNLAAVGHQLRLQVEGFAMSKLGAATLSKALARSGVFEVQPHGGSGRARLKAPHLAAVAEVEDSATAGDPPAPCASAR